jgi:hypothetical protein
MPNKKRETCGITLFSPNMYWEKLHRMTDRAED